LGIDDRSREGADSFKGLCRTGKQGAKADAGADFKPRSRRAQILKVVRLEILRVLQESAGYEANESMIAAVLRARDHIVSRDQVRTDFAWLKEQGLLTLTLTELATVQVAELTQRGLETASGIVTTPGVKRPAPRP
jgi:hypothetical protein